jgi:hypothetical protein
LLYIFCEEFLPHVSSFQQEAPGGVTGTATESTLGLVFLLEINLEIVLLVGELSGLEDEVAAPALALEAALLVSGTICASLISDKGCCKKKLLFEILFSRFLCSNDLGSHNFLSRPPIIPS